MFTLISVCSTHLPITHGGNFVISAWIKIPEGFEPWCIAPVLAGFETLTQWTADPKTRDRWQRAWVSATLPEDARGVGCALLAEGAPGGAFQSTGWCLERGTRPSGYGFEV